MSRSRSGGQNRLAVGRVGNSDVLKKDSVGGEIRANGKTGTTKRSFVKNMNVRIDSRRNIHRIPKGFIHVQESFNNTTVTVTDVRGRVVSWASAGTCGFKGARKGTLFAAQTAARYTVHTVVDLGSQSRKRRKLRAIRISGTLLTFWDVTPMPHNGCRLPKKGMSSQHNRHCDAKSFAWTYNMHGISRFNRIFYPGRRRNYQTSSIPSRLVPIRFLLKKRKEDYAFATLNKQYLCYAKARKKRVVIHQPASSFYEAKTGEFIVEVEELLKLRETLIRVYVQRMGKPLWIVFEDMERDVFMSATEAQTYGIIDPVAIE
ncbi:hypothetical protein RJ639_037652 [Escallonia herrerae]|uniref:ATP-dependent Clp protease proteolytic subunit n=1 Tax=Escallonia herrerae TaxID=1293975 RepID=A0AA88WK38_9ASTE|nr:hypothetical protein RJ639_037652 [Escallonia herrerae]